MPGFMSMFGYPWLKQKAETSSFFGCLYTLARIAAFLVLAGVVILIIALALKHR